MQVSDALCPEVAGVSAYDLAKQGAVSQKCGVLTQYSSRLGVQDLQAEGTFGFTN